MYMNDRFKVGVVAGWAIIGTFGAVIVVLAFLRLVGYMFRPMLVRRKDTWIGRMFRNHIVEAPLAGEKRATPYSTRNGVLVVRAPGRIHSIAVFALIVTNVVTAFAFYHHLPASERMAKVLGTPTHQNVRSFADRAAMLCLAQLPLLFLFSGRSGPLPLLTGCNYNTMMLYHRWLGRMVTLAALGHAIAYTWVHFSGGGAASWVTERWLCWGIVGTSFFCCACVFSYTPLRRLSYEFFLILHIAFVTWSFIGLWRHIVEKRTMKSPFMPYLFVTLGFWCFDRLVRFLRLILANFSVAPAGMTKATARALPDGTLHIRVHPAGQAARSLLAPRAGQHVYINMPSVQIGSLHPVTVVAGGKDAGRPYFDLVVQPHKGFTQRLANRIVAANNQLVCTALVEGPYGHHVRTDGYDRVLLMAGGIGVTHTLSILLDLLRSHALYRDEEASRSQEVTLIWAFRQPETFYVALPYLLAAAQELDMANVPMHEVKITVRAFVTGTSTGESVALSNSSHPGTPTPSPTPAGELGTALHEKDLGEKVGSDAFQVPALSHGNETNKGALLDETVADAEEHVLSSLAHHTEDISADMRSIARICNVSFLSVRPDIEGEMRAHLLPSTGRRSLVVSCGSTGFSDRVRAAARAVRGQTNGLDLDEEVFAW